MIKLAKKKKTAFAKALLASGESGNAIQLNIGSSTTICNELGSDVDDGLFLQSDRPLTTANGTFGAFSRTNKVTSITNLVFSPNSEAGNSDLQDGRFIASPAELKRA